MSLLSRLATKIDKLSTELAATEALGLILASPVAAMSVTSLLRAVAPNLPAPLRYTTQAGEDDGRPDIIGRDESREVLHLEGKFWAGLTDSQARGGYLERLRRQHAEHAPEHPHVGALVFVVPPRRTATLMDELVRRYDLTAPESHGGWWSAHTVDGMTVAVTSWDELLGRLAGMAYQEVAEDSRQLLDLVRQVDHGSFVPWSAEQLTDQDGPRRLLALASMVESVHEKLLRTDVATPPSRRTTITRGGPLSFGKQMLLGGVQVTLRVHLELWARHRRSPLWLTFRGTGAARRVFAERLIEADGWIAVDIPLPEGQVGDDVRGHLVAWLTDAGRQLQAALNEGVPLGEETAAEENEEPGEDVDETLPV